LSLSHPQLGHASLQVQVEIEFAHHGLGLPSRLVFVERSETADGFMSEAKVFESGKRIDEHEVLVDEADTASNGLGGGGRRKGHALDEHASLVSFLGTSGQFEQRGLSSSIFADQGVHLSVMKRGGSVRDSEYRTETSGQVFELQGWFRQSVGILVADEKKGGTER